jgi:hypothetical protein
MPPVDEEDANPGDALALSVLLGLCPVDKGIANRARYLCTLEAR